MKISRTCRAVRIVTIGLLLSTPLVSPSPGQSRSANPRIERNITYRTVSGARLQLDLATPATGSGLRPAILFIHGGGWRSGNRGSFSSEIVNAARRGFVAATVTYRLTRPAGGVPAAAWPAQYEDVSAALAWLRSHAGKYAVDPRRIAAFGESAGAHLSLLLAFKDSAPPETAIRAVVNFYGPVDLAALHNDSGATRAMLEPFLGGSPRQRPQNYAAASPIRFIGSKAPQIVTFHGDRDTLVPLSQARQLDQVMRQQGHQHVLQIVRGEAHGFKGTQRRKYFDAAYVHLNRHLTPSSKVVTKPAPGRPPAGTKAGSVANTERAAAEWVLGIGGSVTLAGAQEVKPGSDLPPGRIEIRKIALNRNSRVTDNGMRHLAGLRHLNSLNLNGTRIGDAAIPHLISCPKLDTLGLFGTGVTDAGVRQLGALKQLRTLILQNTAVSASAVKSLRHVLPDCRISN